MAARGIRAFTPLPPLIRSKGRADFSSQNLSHFPNLACDKWPRPPIPQIAEMAVTAIQTECQNGRVGGLIVSGCRKGARMDSGEVPSTWRAGRGGGQRRRLFTVRRGSPDPAAIADRSGYRGVEGMPR